MEVSRFEGTSLRSLCWIQIRNEIVCLLDLFYHQKYIGSKCFWRKLGREIGSHYIKNLRNYLRKADFKALIKREVVILFSDNFSFLKANSIMEGDVHLSRKIEAFTDHNNSLLNWKTIGNPHSISLMMMWYYKSFAISNEFLIAASAYVRPSDSWPWPFWSRRKFHSTAILIFHVFQILASTLLRILDKIRMRNRYLYELKKKRHCLLLKSAVFPKNSTRFILDEHWAHHLAFPVHCKILPLIDFIMADENEIICAADFIKDSFDTKSKGRRKNKDEIGEYDCLVNF